MIFVCFYYVYWGYLVGEGKNKFIELEAKESVKKRSMISNIDFF